MIKKADIILAAILIVLGCIIVYTIAINNVSGQTVNIYVGEELYGSYDLHIDKKIVIDNNSNQNIIEIKDGKAFMSSASCMNHQCVNQGSICNTAESIICLPNKILVEISGSDSAYDAISN